jgi:hypothetical protein
VSEPWYRDRKALALIFRGYLPWLALMNFAWETVQLPLYTIWAEGTRAEIAFAVFHCTLGDLLIGAAALALSLMLLRATAPADWRWGAVSTLLVILGAGYTVFSEWINTSLLRWSYSSLMPTFEVFGNRIGVSPLAQWLVIPPLALSLAKGTVR